MRKLATALLGRVTRRAIVQSPHTWNATAATFVAFAISDLVVSLVIDGVKPERLYLLAAVIGAIGITVFLTRPPERGSPYAHLLVIAVYGGVSLAVFAHAPQGAAPMITGMFIPVLTALWIEERRHAVAHLTAASALLVAASITGGNDPQTLAAALAFVPALLLLYAATNVVLDALDAQADALDDLALRDPLTGIGNAAAITADLQAELTRHRSGGRTLAVVDLAVDRFPELVERVGTAAGDAVLLAVAAALGRLAPGNGTIARFEGEHFVAVLPNASAGTAARFVEQVLTALPARVGGGTLAVRAGTAMYPDDGVRPARLLAVALERRHTTAQVRPAAAAVQDGESAPWTVMVGGFEAPAPPQLPPRVRRLDIAADRLIWAALGTGLLGYCSVAVVAWLLIDGFAGDALPYFAAVGVVAGLATLVTRPPRIDDPWNHLALATSYVLPIAAMVLAAPEASWGVTTAMLAPLLITARLTERRQIAAHFIVLTVGLVVAAIVAGFDGPACVGVAALITNTWVLGVCSLVVFEAAERQTEEIRGLVVRDSLTGAGNRRLLRERLSDELGRHDALQMSLVLADLELPDFDALVQQRGRGVANTLLRDLAGAVGGVGGPSATVARIAGSHFQMLMPLTDLSEPGGRTAEALIGELAQAVADCAAGGVELHPRIGVAQYPEDATTADDLELVAQGRRRLGPEAATLITAAPHPPRGRLRGRRSA